MEELIERLKKSLKLHRDKDLTTILNVKQSTISTWKSRDTIDYRMVIDICKSRNIDLGYIFYGVDKAQAATDNCKNCDKLRHENEQYRQKIHDLQIKCQAYFSLLTMKQDQINPIKGLNIQKKNRREYVSHMHG
jgi:hypothetical protein